MPARRSSPTSADHIRARLHAAFDREVAGPRVAGLAAGVTVGAATIFEAIQQRSPIDDAARPFDASTLFRIASITKTFTALAVMQLVDHQRISLDDPVTRHLHAVRLEPTNDAAPDVTIRHLLTHQAGLADPLHLTDLLHPARFIGPRLGQHIPNLAELYRGGIRPSRDPGTAWSYSNDGYALLGQLVEDVTGIRYADYVRDHIWQPLQMRASTFAPSADAPVAAGHRHRRGRLRPVPLRVVVKAGAGGAFSSLTDMLRYTARLAAPRQHGALRPDLLEQMYQPEVALTDRVPFFGLGFFLDDFAGHRIVFHPGDLPGGEAALFVAPDDHVGVVVLCNSTARGTALRLARHLLAQALDVDSALLAGRASVPAHVASQVVGTYVAEAGWRRNLRVAGMTGGRLNVEVRSGRLVLRGRFGALRRPVDLRATAGGDELHLHLLLRGVPYDGVPVDVVFDRGPDGRAQRLDLGLLGARFHRCS